VRDGGVVIERSFADALGLRAGDRVTLNGRPFTVAGVAVTAALPTSGLGFLEGSAQWPNPGLIWLTEAAARSLATSAQPLGYLLNLKLANPAGAEAFANRFTAGGSYTNNDRRCAPGRVRCPRGRGGGGGPGGRAPDRAPAHQSRRRSSRYRGRSAAHRRHGRDRGGRGPGGRGSGHDHAGRPGRRECHLHHRAAVQDSKHASAVTRVLGATPQQVTAGLAAAQVLPAAAGALAGIPGGFALFRVASEGGSASQPPAWWLVAVVLGTVIAVAGLTSIPARIGARRRVAGILQSEAG
jgi:hypothetical protein